MQNTTKNRYVVKEDRNLILSLKANHYMSGRRWKMGKDTFCKLWKDHQDFNF